MDSKKISTAISEVESVDLGYVVVRIRGDVDQTLELAKENLGTCIQLCSGKKRPLLLDLRRARPLTPEIRQYYKSGEVAGHFCAIALLVEASFFGRMLGNFYLEVAQTGIPKRLFEYEKSAIAWLGKYINDGTA